MESVPLSIENIVRWFRSQEQELTPKALFWQEYINGTMHIHQELTVTMTLLL